MLHLTCKIIMLTWNIPGNLNGKGYKPVNSNDWKFRELIHIYTICNCDSVHGPAFPMLNGVRLSSRAYISCMMQFTGLLFLC
mgnify:CR=1 FL=1